MRHEFESGEWVEYTPAGELKHKHRVRLRKVANAATPLNDEDDVDREFIRAQPGGMAGFNLAYLERRFAALVALVVSAWSYPVPVPSITADGTDLENEESTGETDLELQALLAPHLEKLTREPDPKETTTSASNGRSKAKAAGLKA